MKTLYVTDLDGTLLRNDKSISDYSIRVFNELIHRGECITFATARSVKSASRLTGKIHFDLPVITKNGAVIAKHSTGEETEVAFFTREECQNLTQYFLGKGLNAIITEYREQKEYKKIYTGRTNKGLDLYLADHDKDDRMILCEKEEDIYKGRLTYFVFIGSREELEPFYEEIKAQNAYSIVFYQDSYSKEYWIEIFPKHASKAIAIQKIKEQYHCDRIVCFGDSPNDLSMFEIADASFAVENAVTEIREIASGIIPSNEDDGVARWLARNFSIED